MDFDEIVRCPKCGQNAEDNMFFSDDDVDHDFPICECGYEWPVAEDVQAAPTECPECHAIALYSKLEAGYPGLYHCAECRAWIDTTTGEGWRWEFTDAERGEAES